MGSLLFWMQQSPGGPDQTEWMAFLNAMAGLLVASVLLTGAAVWILYVWMATRKKITSVDALYSSYEPLRPYFVGMPIVFLIMLIRCYYVANEQFPSDFSSIYYGVTLGLAATFMYGLLTYGVLLLLTPKKFKYRPWLKLLLRSPQ